MAKQDLGKPTCPVALPCTFTPKRLPDVFFSEWLNFPWYVFLISRLRGSWKVFCLSPPPKELGTWKPATYAAAYGLGNLQPGKKDGLHCLSRLLVGIIYSVVINLPFDPSVVWEMDNLAYFGFLLQVKQSMLRDVSSANVQETEKMGRGWVGITSNLADPSGIRASHLNCKYRKCRKKQSFLKHCMGCMNCFKAFNQRLIRTGGDWGLRTSGELWCPSAFSNLGASRRRNCREISLKRYYFRQYLLGSYSMLAGGA